MNRTQKNQKSRMEKTIPLLIGAGCGVALTSLITLSIGSLQSRPQYQLPLQTHGAQIRQIHLEERTQPLLGRVDSQQGEDLPALPLLVQSRQEEIGPLQAPQPLPQTSQGPSETPLEMPLGFGLKSEKSPPTSPKNPSSENPSSENPSSENPSSENQSSENQSSENQSSETGEGTVPDQIAGDKSEESIAADPRELGITANEGPNKEYEETIASVQRTLTAVDSAGEKQLIRLRIPVMYQSRTLRIDDTQKASALTTLNKLREKKGELKKLRTDLEALLQEWNKVVESSTPNELLLPESPTLPQNQSKNDLNRRTSPALSPGKNITYETP